MLPSTLVTQSVFARPARPMWCGCRLSFCGGLDRRWTIGFNYFSISSVNGYKHLCRIRKSGAGPGRRLNRGSRLTKPRFWFGGEVLTIRTPSLPCVRSRARRSGCSALLGRKWVDSSFVLGGRRWRRSRAVRTQHARSENVGIAGQALALDAHPPREVSCRWGKGRRRAVTVSLLLALYGLSACGGGQPPSVRLGTYVTALCEGKARNPR